MKNINSLNFLLLLLVALTVNLQGLGNPNLNQNLEIENIVSDLENAKKQLELSSGVGREISKKIGLLIRTVNIALKNKNCAKKLNNVKVNIQRLIVITQVKTCKNSLPSRSSKKPECIAISDSESSVGLLGEALSSIENILNTDNNNDSIPDVCSSSDIPFESWFNYINPGKISKPTTKTKSIPLTGIELFQQGFNNLQKSEDELKLTGKKIGQDTADDLNSTVIIGLARDIKFSSGDDICTKRINSNLNTLDQIYINDVKNLNCEGTRGLITNECLPASTVTKIVSLLENAKKNIQDSLSIDENNDQVPDICTYFLENEASEQPIPEEFLKSKEPYPIPGQYILEFNDIVTDFDKIAIRFELESLFSIKHFYSNVFKGASIYGPPLDSQEKADFIKRFPFIKDILQDYRMKAFVPDIEPENLTRQEREFSFQSISNPMSKRTLIPLGIRWIGADKNENEGLGFAYPTPGKTAVAVLDSGIDLNHLDLRNNIDRSLSQDLSISTLRFNNSGTGGNDDAGHGTSVAGIIAAVPGNTKDYGNFLADVIGVGSSIRLISLKIFRSDLSFDIQDFISGMEQVLGNKDKIAVANLSLGGCLGREFNEDEDGPFIDTINKFRYAIKAVVKGGVIVVASAGNGLRDIHKGGCFPANFPEVISVSGLRDGDGIRNDDDKWYFTSNGIGSNYGKEVDIIAPAQNIITTALGTNDPTLVSGTSLAAPHVSGTLILYIARNGKPKNGDASKEEVQKIIKAISVPRDKSLPDEPDDSTKDGFLEPYLNANGPLVRP